MSTPQTTTPTTSQEDSPPKASKSAVAQTPPFMRLWSVIAFCSIVVLASVLDLGFGERNSALRVSHIITTIISFLVALVFVVAHSSKCPPPLKQFPGTIIELGCAGVSFIIWLEIIINYFNAMGNGVISVPVNGANIPIIENANQYYYSWFALITSLLLLSTSLQLKLKIDGDESERAPFTRFTMWLFLGCASFTLMCCGANIIATNDCKAIENNFCRNAGWTTGIGTYSWLACAAVIVAKFLKVLPADRQKLIEASISTSIAIIYIIAMHFITGPNSPGESVGTLYYSAWACFLGSGYISYLSTKEADVKLPAAVSNKMKGMGKKGGKSKTESRTRKEDVSDAEEGKFVAAEASK